MGRVQIYIQIKARCLQKLTILFIFYNRLKMPLEAIGALVTRFAAQALNAASCLAGLVRPLGGCLDFERWTSWHAMDLREEIFEEVEHLKQTRLALDFMTFQPTGRILTPEYLAPVRWDEDKIAENPKAYKLAMAMQDVLENPDKYIPLDLLQKLSAGERRNLPISGAHLQARLKSYIAELYKRMSFGDEWQACARELLHDADILDPVAEALLITAEYSLELQGHALKRHNAREVAAHICFELKHHSNANVGLHATVLEAVLNAGLEAAVNNTLGQLAK
jgi:hypothetical protein